MQITTSEKLVLAIYSSLRSSIVRSFAFLARFNVLDRVVSRKTVSPSNLRGEDACCASKDPQKHRAKDEFRHYISMCDIYFFTCENPGISVELALLNTMQLLRFL